MSKPDALDVRDEAVLQAAMDWRAAGAAVALATVVKTWGSAPRQVGAHMAIAADGRLLGSVSGGCIEGDVVTAAEAVLASGAPRLLEYGVSNDEAWDVGLACGGKVQVYVEPLL